MSKQSKNTIRNWFKNGAFPNQHHFWDWMDSFFHKDEQIPASQIDQLQDLLDAKVDRKDLPDGEMAMDDISGLNSALDAKVDKEDGKGLSTEDFSSDLKTKLDGVEDGANKYEHPLTHSANMIEETADKAFTSDAEKLANANHIANTDLHKTSEQIRSEIVDVDIPISIARQSDVATSADGVLSAILGGVSESYDTLKKVYDWIFVHDGNTDIHKTSEQIRSEIVDEDIPVSLARVNQLTTENIAGSVCETLEEAQDKAYDGYTCYVKADQKSYVFKLEEEIVLDEENNEVVNQKFIPYESGAVNQDDVASPGGLYDWNVAENAGANAAHNQIIEVKPDITPDRTISIKGDGYTTLNFLSTNMHNGLSGKILFTHTKDPYVSLYVKVDGDSNSVFFNSGDSKGWVDAKSWYTIIRHNERRVIEYSYINGELILFSRSINEASTISSITDSATNAGGNYDLRLEQGEVFRYKINTADDVILTATKGAKLRKGMVLFVGNGGVGTSTKVTISNMNLPGGSNYFMLDHGKTASLRYLVDGNGAYLVDSFSNTSTPVAVSSGRGIYDWNATDNSGAELATLGQFDASKMNGNITKVSFNNYSQMNFTNLTDGDSGTIAATSTSSFDQFLYFSVDTDFNKVYVNTGVEVVTATGGKRIYIPAYGLSTIEWLYDGTKLRITSRGLASSGAIGDATSLDHNSSGTVSIDLKKGLSHSIRCKHSSNIAVLNPAYYQDNIIYTLRLYNESPDNSKMKVQINKIINFPGGKDHFYLDPGVKATIQFYMSGGSAWVTGYANASAVESGSALSSDSAYLPSKLEFTADTPLISKEPGQTVTLSYNVWGNLKSISKVEILDKADGMVKIDSSIVNNHDTGTHAITGLEALDGAQKYTLKVTYADTTSETKELEVESVEYIHIGPNGDISNMKIAYSQNYQEKFLIPIAQKEFEVSMTPSQQAYFLLTIPSNRPLDKLWINGRKVLLQTTVSSSWSTATSGCLLTYNKKNLETATGSGRFVDYDARGSYPTKFFVGPNAVEDLTIKLKFT